MIGASLNFVNSIIGAGCIGLGGAMGSSGGCISIGCVLLFGWMTKLSFDLTIALSISNDPTASTSSSSSSSSTFESLGRRAYGPVGSALVGLSKFGFSFGCMVAYIVIVKENFATAFRNLLGTTLAPDGSVVPSTIWLQDNVAAFVLSATVMLPLSSLRDVTPLEKFSLLKIAALIMITVILFVLWVLYTENGSNNNALDESPALTFYHHWFEIQPGFIRNMGTFVLTYTANHTIHLVFLSLEMQLQTLDVMKQITLNAIVLSSMLIVPIGLFPYMTFWEQTGTNLFELYRRSPLVDGARLLLSMVMLLTYPMPFFSCREVLVMWLPESWRQRRLQRRLTLEEWIGTTKLKIDGDSNAFDNTNADNKASSSMTPEQDPLLLHRNEPTSYPQGSPEPIPFFYHMALTLTLWGVTVSLALVAPSLGDVLNLVGCATGTMISFVLPGLFAIKLQKRCTATSFLLLGVGVPVGCIGTYYSLLHLLQ